MIQCKDCEFCENDAFGNVRLRCNPFTNIKEPECLTKWQLVKIDTMVQAYQRTIEMYQRIAPIQEKMLRHMEKEIDDAEDADSWKKGCDDEEDDDEPRY